MLAAGTADEDDKGSLGADATVRFYLNEAQLPARCAQYECERDFVVRSVIDRGLAPWRRGLHAQHWGDSDFKRHAAAANPNRPQGLPAPRA